MSLSKIMWLDVETSGLQPNKHAIIQIAAIVQIGNKVTATFETKVRPDNVSQIDPKTMEFHGFGAEEFFKEDEDGHAIYKPSPIAFADFLSFMEPHVDKYDKTDKFCMAGYNLPNFDYKFMQTLFKRCGDSYFNSWFTFPGLDVMQLAAFVLSSKRTRMENFKLGTVAKELGIPIREDELHGAMYDVEVTRLVALRCFELLKGV